MSADQASFPAYSKPPLRILVVEDHTDTADAIALVAQSRGHEVRTARTLADAKSVCNQRRFDLILCDIKLPDGDGTELAHAVNTRNPATKLIAVTGYGMPDEKRRILNAGFDAHLLKPLDLEALDAFL